VARARSSGKLLSLIVLCVAVRLAFLLSWPEDYSTLQMDVDGYWAIGGNVRAGNGFAVGQEPSPTATRLPVYPLYLAAVHLVTGGRERIALASQALVDAATCVALYLLAKLVTGSSLVAYLACLFWAVYLPEVSQITRFWSEPLCALLLTCALLLYLLARQREALWLYAMSGLVFGTVALTRAEFMLLPLVFVGLIVAERHETMGRRAFRTAVFLLAFIVPFGPWAIRNAVTFRAFIPAVTSSGLALFVGNSTLDEEAYLTKKSWSYAVQKLQSRAPEAAQSSEVELDRLFRREAFHLIREHPLRFATLTIVRFPRLWFSIGFGRTPGWTSLGVAGINFLLLVLGMIGLILTRRKWPAPAAPLVLTLLYGTLVHLPIDGMVRHVFPLIPALTILSTVGVLVGRRRLRADLSPLSSTYQRGWA